MAGRRYMPPATRPYGGKSFEELRLEDYELGRDAGRWWIGGSLQVKKNAAPCGNPHDVPHALDQQYHTPDSDEKTALDGSPMLLDT